MANKSNQSRFGNPTKAAAAEGATANNVVSLADAIVQRAKSGQLPPSMDRLVPAFKNWMAAAGMPADEIDRMSRLLMNYFRNYTASVPSPDPTKLDVGLTRKMLEDAGRFHPEMRVSISLALNSYLKFLLTTKAWTGPYDDLLELLRLTDEVIFTPPGQELASYVYHDGIDPVAAAEDRAGRKYVRRAIALLAWIGEGRELTATGNIRRKDLAEAAACVDFSAVGSARTLEIPAGDAPQPVASMDGVPRLPEYWCALIDTKLIKVIGKKVELTRAGKAFLNAPAAASQKTAELAYCLFYDAIMPYDEAAPITPADTTVARMLAAAASSRPDIAIPFETAEPDPPFVLSKWRAIAVNHVLTDLATAGLVEQGTDLVVPPSLRSALAPVLEHLDKMIEKTPDA